MLCINNYPQTYINECRTRVQSQIASYRNLVTGNNSNNAIEAFEPVFFNNMVLVLDQLFVHRSRTMELKDGNPLNEVRLLCQSMMTNNGKLCADKSMKLDPTRSILQYRVGDEIKLNEADFVRLAEAFFAEIECKFGEAS